MKSRVGERGQVTIPKKLRDSLAIRPGTELAFEEKDGALVARPTTHRDPIDRLWGILPPFDVDSEIEAMRGPAWNEKMDGPRWNHRKTTRAKPSHRRKRAHGR